eukprot:TRINITY_DN5168_c2_g1_i2.p1 TRINITY_DN5168_c2_g1~~TRINITY_DN5168_c2_g1_i2.p1  ORF type:complete len:1487 (-),score=479.48 TRINITY_DN5168_c2_g1_i2:82-4542(-)
MSIQEVRNLLKYRLDHTENLQNIYTLGQDLLRRTETDLVFDLCRYSEQRLSELDEARKFRDQRQQELDRLKVKLPVYDENRKLIELEEYLSSQMPDYLRLGEEQIQTLRYQFSEMMVNGALSQKTNLVAKMVREGKQDINDEELDRPVIRVIEDSMKYLISPFHLLQLCRIIDSAGYPRLALPVAEHAHKVLLELRKKLKERAELTVRMNLLDQEGNRLKRIKKELPKEKLDQILELKKTIQEFNIPYTGPLIAHDANALEQQSLQIALVMIACAVNYKKNLMDKKMQVVLKKDVFTMKEKQALSDPKSLDELIKKVLNWALEPGRVEDPSHMMQLARNISEPDLPFVFSIGERVRKRIKELKVRHDEQVSFNAELSQLQDEREKLLTQWKFLSDEKVKRLEELEFINDVNVSITPNYMNSTKDKLSKLELEIAKYILDSIYDQKDKFEDVLANPKKYPNAPKLSGDEIAAKRKEFLDRVLEVIEEIEDPLHLFQISEHVQSRKDSENVLKVGEKCQRVIKHIEELREIRAPLQTELNQLTASKEDLLRRNRPFSQEKQERLDELTQSISKLAPWPEYATLFNHHQYDELNLDIVRVMTSAILDNKTSLEEEIARMFKENAPENIDHDKIEKDRAQIQQRIRELTKQCLTKFSNPVYLLKFANDMKRRNETDIVLEVVQKCIEKIRELNEQRKKRKPLQQELDELELSKEEASKAGKSFSEDKINQLKSQLDSLPIWPHFASVYSDDQYDNSLHQCVQLALNSVLDDRDAHERQIAKQFYDDRDSVDHGKIEAERTVKQNRIDQALQTCFDNVVNPNHLSSLVDEMSRRKESKISLQIARHCLRQIESLRTLRTTRNSIKHQISILEEEEKFLQSRKKSLDDNASLSLSNLKKELSDLTVPGFISTHVDHQSILDSLLEKMVQTVLNKKTEINKKLETDQDMTDDRISYWKKYIVETTDDLLDQIHSYSNNPISLLTILRNLRQRQEFTSALKIGEHAFNRIEHINKIRSSHSRSTQELQALLSEEDQLHKIMKYLPKDKKERLRDLQLEDNLFKEQPGYYQTSYDPDSTAYDLSTEMISICLDLQKAKSTASDSMEVEGDSEEDMKVRTTKIVALCLDHIMSINSLINMVSFLNSRHEYQHVITAGKKCQERIFDKKKEFQEREELKDEFERLDSLRLQQLYIKTEGGGKISIDNEDLQKKIDEIKESIEALPKMENFEEEAQKLNQQLLQTTDLIMTAAKIENDEKELRAQTIMAFKADTTTERWDRVRLLIPEEEWETVKQELVVYVLKQNTNINDKIELLLKDGLYKQVIDVFPKPKGKKGEIDLLLKVYQTIEQKSSDLLEQMVPLVSHYMKRYFQEYKYKSVYKLLDRFQRRFPSIVVNLLTKACDMLMLDIMPSQYGKFVEMLRQMKQRLESINRHDDWNDFLSEFKKHHSGKKKLIQMVSLIGDSSWDLETVMGKKPRKRARIEKKAKKESDGEEEDE